MTNETDVRVFYSWQSDISSKTNLNAIRNSLRAASSKVEEQHGVRIILDEATRGEPGSPNIPLTILRKITDCDVFLCDVTTINSDAADHLRKTPNPNVLFELGYAVSQLGWPRIVMLFNREYGKFPNDLPFDVDRHRASPYRLTVVDPKNKSNIAHLEKQIRESVSSIIQSDPQRPHEALDKSPEEIRRLRDIANISWALAAIHVPTLDEMIDGLPRQISDKAFHFWETFRSIVTSSLFHIYDETASKLMFEVFSGWHGCTKHDEHYQNASNPHLYIFSNPGRAPLDERQQAAWQEIESSADELKKSFAKLLAHVRNEFMEIDLDALNKAAWIDYVEFEREITNKLKEYGIQSVSE